MRLSSGLLMYRVSDGVLEVLIAHMGGPFWMRKDAAAWSIPKGEHSAEEDPLAVAYREFEEELGKAAPSGETIELGTIRQPSGKIINVFALCGDFDPSEVASNRFDLEWPRGSGNVKSFPEIDKACWMDCATARNKLVKGQLGFIDRLVKSIRDRGECFTEERVTPHR